MVVINKIFLWVINFVYKMYTGHVKGLLQGAVDQVRESCAYEPVIVNFLLFSSL